MSLTIESEDVECSLEKPSKNDFETFHLEKVSVLKHHLCFGFCFKKLEN